MITASNRVVMYLGRDCINVALYAGPLFHIHDLEEYTEIMARVFLQVGEDATFLYSSSITNPTKLTKDEKLIALCHHATQE